jgi:hypothetical protein
MTVRIRVSHEYDDEGGAYRSFSCEVDDLVFLPGTQVPQDLCWDGQPDEELAVALLEDKLNELGADTVLCLEQQNPVEDELVLAVSRDRLRGLWKGFPVSGVAAFTALFGTASVGLSGDDSEIKAT